MTQSVGLTSLNPSVAAVWSFTRDDGQEMHSVSSATSDARRSARLIGID